MKWVCFGWPLKEAAGNLIKARCSTKVKATTRSGKEIEEEDDSSNDKDCFEDVSNNDEGCSTTAETTRDKGKRRGTQTKTKDNQEHVL